MSLLVFERGELSVIDINSAQATALNSLGDEYYYDGKYHRAYKVFKKAMDLGCVDAKANVALCYQTGHGVNVDIKKAIQLYNEAISEGSSLAANNLAYFYLNDFDDKETKMRGIRIYIKSAVEFSNAQAALTLAKDVFDDTGILPHRSNYLKALLLAEKNVLKEVNYNPEMAFDIYYMIFKYYTGITESKQRARMQQELYKKYVSQLEAGDYCAAVGISNLYQNGIFVAKDYRMSKEYLTRASKHNVGFANYLLKHGWKDFTYYRIFY